MLQNNPYSVFSETISFQNVQQIGELITLKYFSVPFILIAHYENHGKSERVYASRRGS